MTAKARLLLPPPPRGGDPWDALRRDLRRNNLHLTILGLTPSGRPHIKLVGPRDALRAWLDGCGYQCVIVEEVK